MGYLAEKKNMKALLVLLMVVSFSVVARADDDKPNCKLTIRVYKKDGSRKLNVEMVHASSKQDCKEQANSRKLTSDAEVDKIQVSYGWQE